MHLNLTGHCLVADPSLECIDGRLHRYSSGLKKLLGIRRAPRWWQVHGEGVNPFEANGLAIKLQSTGVNNTGIAAQDAQFSTRLASLSAAFLGGFGPTEGRRQVAERNTALGFLWGCALAQRERTDGVGEVTRQNLVGSFRGGHLNFEALTRSMSTLASVSAWASCSTVICLLSVSLIRPASRRRSGRIAHWRDSARRMPSRDLPVCPGLWRTSRPA